MRPLFTPDELAELSAADAEIDAAPLTLEDYRETDGRDRSVRMERKGPKGRKVAAQKKAYREANREKYNTYMREYMRKRSKKIYGNHTVTPGDPPV